MNTQQLERVKSYYNSQGLNINSKTIENCLSSTGEVYSLSSKEVYSVISPYFYENTTEATSTATSTGLTTAMHTAMRTVTHDVEEKITSHAQAHPQIDALTYSSDDFTDIAQLYDKNIDDQAKNIVKFADQEYLSIDFTKKVVFRFPIFDENSYIPPVFEKQKYYQIQKRIREELPKLENINWTNQTLSYARSNIVGKHIIECIIAPLYRKGLFGREGRIRSPLKVVDATGNIGADSILFAMERFVSSVKVYEILPNVYDMLVNNIHLYGMDKKIQALNKRFDYDVPKNSLVMIDPPYEADNNRGNFNLSIDNMPIYYVAQKVLDAGAACVILSMPRTYKYNTKFALDHDQHVSVYQMGKINNKMYLVCKLSDAERIGLVNFNYTLVTTDETQKMWNGKVNAYKCKSESKYTNANIEKVPPLQWRLVLPRDKYGKDKEGNITLPKEVKDIIKDVRNL